MRADLTGRDAGFSNVITAGSSAISALADASRVAIDLLQQLNQVSQEFAENESIARSFGLTRQEYERFRLAVSASIGDITEARDLLGDFQEAVSLLGRGEEREVRLFRELGFDIDFARAAQEDLTGSFDLFIREIERLDEVAARGILTELVGADASRQINQLARSYGRFADVLGRPLIFATDEAVEQLNNLRTASEAAGRQMQESIVQALADSGLAEVLSNTIDRFGSLVTTTDILEVGFARAGIAVVRFEQAIAGLQLLLAVGRGDRAAINEIGLRSLGLSADLVELEETLQNLLLPGRQSGGAGTGRGTGGGPSGTSSNPIFIAPADGFFQSMALPVSDLAFIELTPEQAALAQRLGFSVARDFTSYMEDTIRPALESAFGPFIDDRINVLGEDSRIAADDVRLLGQVTRTVFGQIRREGDEAVNVLLDILQTFLNAGFSNLLGGLSFFGGSRQFGGPVEEGLLYETHGLGRREFFIPDSPGRIEVGRGGDTFFIEAGVNADQLVAVLNARDEEVEVRITNNLLRDYRFRNIDG